MDRLRLPLFVLAALALLLVIGVESGSAAIKGKFDAGYMKLEAARQLQSSSLSDDDRAAAIEQMTAAGASASQPPGLAIPYVALLDALTLFAVLLMAASPVVPESAQGKVQG